MERNGFTRSLFDLVRGESLFAPTEDAVSFLSDYDDPVHMIKPDTRRATACRGPTKILPLLLAKS
jgi:hypothetical protein